MKRASGLNKSHIISTDEDPDRKLCSNKFTWCFHKQDYYLFYRAMQTAYKELIED